MTCYLLLRNNVETGPFSFEELTAQHLKPSDLIWIEGESTLWKFQTEISTLKQQVTRGPSVEPNQPISKMVTTSKGISVALPQEEPDSYFTEKEHVELETKFEKPLDVLRDRFEATKTGNLFPATATFSKPHNALWLCSVFAGLLVAAVLIKTIIATYDERSAVITAAAKAGLDREHLITETDEDLYQNALTTEVVPVDTVTLKPVKRETPKADLKKLVRLEANDYQIGLFGGIKNLRILVVNKSAFVLEKVRMELQYRKPNGDVVKTETLTFKSIAPKSRKSLAVPANNRGVKVTYRITDIQSKQNTNALVSL